MPINDTNIPELSDIKDAVQRIKSYVHKTPVFTSRYYDKLTDSEVFFKCENFQRVGAFKFRGACNAVFKLTEKEAENGVATHSSGNHAQALSLAAKLRGIPAHIVMPENAPEVKKRAVKEYGAKITFCKSTLDARETTLQKIIEQTGACFIHPYNNPDIIAGQGTSALEFLAEIRDLDMILVPVGGGGLLSGTAIAAKKMKPEIKVIGCEPELADDAYRSFKSGKLIKINQTETIADGLRTSLGDLTFETILKYVDDIVTVSESSIIRDMRIFWERLNIIIEASCAVPVSALADKKIDAEGGKIGVIITGGNVDLDRLPWLTKP